MSVGRLLTLRVMVTVCAGDSTISSLPSTTTSAAAPPSSSLPRMSRTPSSTMVRYLPLFLLPSLAAAYSFNIDNTPRQCQNLTVSITGTGQPPYNLIVIPFGPTPLSTGKEARKIIQQNFTGNSVTFPLNFPVDSQFIVQVSISFLCTLLLWPLCPYAARIQSHRFYARIRPPHHCSQLLRHLFPPRSPCTHPVCSCELEDTPGTSSDIRTRNACFFCYSCRVQWLLKAHLILSFEYFSSASVNTMANYLYLVSYPTRLDSAPEARQQLLRF